jgi:proteasome assembly chaperone (PAC2) family protein
MNGILKMISRNSNNILKQLKKSSKHDVEIKNLNERIDEHDKIIKRLEELLMVKSNDLTKGKVI